MSAAASAAYQLARAWAVGPGVAAKPAPKAEQPKQIRTKAEWVERERLAPANLAFYRKHTESMLRRHLYASMPVGRAPSILGDSVGRGWASSRPIRTFEDAVIFVLDPERCLEKPSPLDRQMLSRVVCRNTPRLRQPLCWARALGQCRTSFRRPWDRLTEKLLAAGLLILPH